MRDPHEYDEDADHYAAERARDRDEAAWERAEAAWERDYEEDDND